MRACERSRIQTEVQKGAPFLYDIGNGQPNASLRAFKNPNGSTKGCALFVRHWNFLQYGTFRHVRHSTMHSTLCQLRMELTFYAYLGISLSSSITLSRMLW